jgi:hypothetical protein
MLERPGLTERVTWPMLGRLAILGLFAAAVWILLAAIVLGTLSITA